MDYSEEKQCADHTTVEAAADELISEFRARPLQTDVYVAVELEGQLSFVFHNGQLHRYVAGSSETQSCGDNSTWNGARISFRDEAALAEIITRLRSALESNDIAGVLTSFLYEMALPTWSLKGKSVHVSGTAALARLIWAACFGREKSRQVGSNYDWANDDLSQGWVMVHSVSPGIKDRVAMFESNLRKVPKYASDDASDQNNCSTSQLASNHNWLDELIQDLCKTAEEFKSTALRPPSTEGGKMGRNSGSGNDQTDDNPNRCCDASEVATPGNDGLSPRTKLDCLAGSGLASPTRGDTAGKTIRSGSSAGSSPRPEVCIGANKPSWAQSGSGWRRSPVAAESEVKFKAISNVAGTSANPRATEALDLEQEQATALCTDTKEVAPTAVTNSAVAAASLHDLRRFSAPPPSTAMEFL